MSSHFKVTADFNGRIEKRNYFVASEAKARRHAMDDGARNVFRIREVVQTWMNRQYVGREYAMLFLRAIAFQIEAGVQPVTAILTAIESEQEPSMRTRLQPALDALSGGAPISDALYSTGFFDRTIRSILMAGERTGAGNAITSALQYMEGRKAARKAYWVVLYALFMELSTSLSVPPAINEMAIPWIRAHMPKSSTPSDLVKYSDQLDTLELNNQIWMWIGDGLILALVGATVMWFFDPRARDWITHKILMRIPLVGEWYTSDALSRSCKVFAEMLRGGVRINDAIETILRTTDNPVARMFWSKSQQALDVGATPGKAFAAPGLLRKDEVLVLNSAKGNIQIAKSFAAIAEEREWRQKLLGGRIFRASVMLMMIHIGITMIIGFRLFGLFNAGLDMTMSNMTNGI